ncbi:MAG: imidazolonepropionase-like amidohydrolase [Candidatus Paceibacteria bacterium]|jgi:imidazolonepropionase-like amidohydrolase
MSQIAMLKRTWLGLALFALANSSLAQDLAVRAAELHTVSAGVIPDGVVIIRSGKIAAIGRASEVTIPAGFQVLSAAVVTPGLVDAHTVVGIAGYLNQDGDQDQLERSAPLQPELRALDAYNARERLIDWVRSFGVTTLHTGHGPGAVISGQTMVVKTTGDTVESASIMPQAMIAATLGEGALWSDSKPGTRGKAVAMLRDLLIEGQGYIKKQEAEGDAPDTNLRLEAVAQLLRRDLALLVTANRHQDIISAIRVAKEFNLRLVLDSAADAHMVLDEIKRAGVPVILHATMKRAQGEAENLSLETASRLAEAGIPFALQSGFESYVPKTRVVLFEAALAAAHGLGRERALHSITLGPAEILGLGGRIGSLDVGKDGDLALYDGDPFEYTTHCVGTVIEGRVVSEKIR